MKVAILSMAINTNYQFLMRHCAKNKNLYAKRHRYEFEYFLYNDDDLKPRDIYWMKYQFILNNLDKYDYIVWLDADTYIMNFDNKLEIYLNSYLTRNFSIAITKFDSDFDLGVMFIKNSKWTKEFFEILQKNYDYSKDSDWDHIGFKNIYNSNLFNSVDRINIIPSEKSPSLLIDNFSYDKCFILHFAGYYKKSSSMDMLNLMEKFYPSKLPSESSITHKERLLWIQNEAAEEMRRDELGILQQIVVWISGLFV